MFKTDILFTGFYGYRNSGDDAFIEVASWGANKIWKKNNNRFLCKKSNLPKTLKPVKGYPFEVNRTYGIQANLLLNNTQAFVYAGGSTIHGEISSNNIRFKAVQKKISGKKLKFGAIGVSIGPFKSIKDENAVKSYLRQMDFLAVRDQASFDFVSSLDGLPYKPVNAFDLAALLPEIYQFDGRKPLSIRQKVIGISVCQYESLQSNMDIEKEKKRNAMLIKLINKIDEKEDIHFKFFVINGNDKIGDLKLTKEIIARSKPSSYEIYSYNKETKQTWLSIAECDFVISTRLHAAIFACFANTPFMLNEYHRKCGDFLDNIGYNDKLRLYNSDYDIDKIANYVCEIINDANKYIMPTKIIKMKEQAMLNFTSIKF